MSESAARYGFGYFTLCASIPFLFFTLLTFLSFLPLSLALMRAVPAVAEVGFRIININKLVRTFPFSFSLPEATEGRTKDSDLKGR